MKKTLLVICTLLLAIPSASRATLGESTPLSTPANNNGQHVLKSTSVTTNPLYTVQSAQTDGVTVKEYARPDGTVFAVSWSGPVRPDMKQLLGNYFGRFIDASRPGSPPRINKDDLVLQSGGHMGDFFGKAYLPKLIPDGVNVDDLE